MPLTTVLFRHPGMEFKLSQGVTTVVGGNCSFGDSCRPEETPWLPAGNIGGFRGKFTDLDGHYAAVLAQQPAINNIMLMVTTPSVRW